MTRTSVTMTDIAKEVGVSRTAVSFVLNDRAEQHGLSPQLIQRILEVTQEMNYAPPRLAKKLSSQMQKRTMTIAVILPELLISYGAPLVRNIEAEARKKNYQLILAQHENNSQILVDNIEKFIEQRVDGFVIVPTLDFHNLSAFKTLLKSKIPTVFIERDPDDDSINFVSSDVTRAVNSAVKQLVAAGHQRIALYNASSKLVESKLRLRAYCDALESLSIEYDSSLVKNSGAFTSEKTQVRKTGEDLKQWQSLSSPPTAIIAISSTRAIAIYNAAESLEMKIPNDFSLIAITGLEFGNFHLARISSIKFSYAEIGKVACQVLLDNIKNPSMLPRRVYIPAKFVEGDTIKELL